MASQEYSSDKDVQYVSDGHERHTLDVFTPSNNPSGKPFPAIIYVHGGAFKFGDKGTDLLPLRYIDKGYALVSINYRLSGHAIFPAAVQDCKAAIRYIRANAKKYNIDETRIVSMGESAGAYMSLMMGITGVQNIEKFQGGDNLDVSSEVAGTIDYYGPTDFFLMDSHAPSHAFLKHNPADSPESLFIGAHVETNQDKCIEASPMSYVPNVKDTKLNPILICHGTMDCIVPFHQGVMINEKLKEQGQDVTFHPVEGADHVWRNISDEEQKKLTKTTDDFLVRIFGH